MVIKVRYNVFLKFIASYAIVLVIPVILVSLLIYGRFVSILTDEVTNSTEDMLCQIRDVVDVRIQEMVDISSLISLNTKISSLLSSDTLSGNNIYPGVYDAIKELRNYKNANSIIDRIFICFRGNDAVVSDTSKDVFDSVFGNSYYYKNITPEVLNNKIKNLKSTAIMPAETINCGGLNMNVITYMQPLPINGFSYNATLLITMKESMFQALIRNVLNDYNGSVYVLDSNGEIVSAISLGDAIMTNKEAEDFTESIRDNPVSSYSEENGGKILSYVKSSATGWSYAAVIPSVQILKKVNYVKYMSVLIICISLVIGLLLAFMFSRVNYVNIRKVTDIILSNKHSVSGNEYKNEWDLINQSIYNYINENRSLQQKMSDQMPILRNNFYMCLLKGDFNDVAAVNSMKDFLKIEMQHELYAVLLIAIDDYKSFLENNQEPAQGVIKIALSNAAEEICGKFGKGYTIEVNRDKIAVIIGFGCDKNESHKTVNNIANLIKDHVSQNFDFTITVGVSDVHDGILQIKNAHYEACSAVDYRILYGENSVICYFEDRDRINSKYRYSFKEENQIVNYLRAGDYNSIKALLEDIVNSAKNESVSLNIIKCIYLDIVNMALKACNELGIDMLAVEFNLSNMVQQETLDGVCKEVCKFYQCVCKNIQDAKGDKNRELIDNIMKYINNNYTDKSLSVDFLADRFSVSPSYVSRFFKEQSRYNFTDYLHYIRLSKAKELLKHQEKTIAAIADEVGYNSIHNFTRVFKRYEKITPTEYRFGMHKV